MLRDDQLEHRAQVRLGALGLGELAVHDAVGGVAVRVLGVGPVEVVHQQPSAGPQELLDQHDRQAVDRPVLRAVEVDEVEARLAVAGGVRARAHLLLEPPRVGRVLPHDLDAIGDPGPRQHVLRRGVVGGALEVDGS